MSANVERNEQEQVSEAMSIPECAVCLQCCIHPARLPCNHVFCFLCVKGVANQSKKCPLCRHEIPADFLEKPQLLEVEEPKKEKEEYQWFYEGRNGWWQYDQRTSMELELAYKQGRKTCELLIAGFLYIADFESMLQLRRNDPARRRRIKRDLYNVPKKGVAGLRLNGQEENITREIRGAERPTSPQTDDTDLAIQQEDTADIPVQLNVPLTDTTVNEDTLSNDRLLRQQSESLHQVIEQMRSLVLGNSISINNANELLDEPVVNRTESGRHSPSQRQNSSTYFDEVQL